MNNLIQLGNRKLMRRIYRLLVPLLLALVTMQTAIACNSVNSSADGAIRVSSKDFAEQDILGEMYALVLEDRGFKVERKLHLGSSAVVQAALNKGDIDLYPEYTGTALLIVLKLPISRQRQQVYETVAKAYREKFNLAWLEPSPMNNTYALSLTKEKAEKYGLKTISDMVAKASELTMIGPPQFTLREDSLPGLKKTYGDFKLKAYKAVDPGLRYKGLTSGQADVVVGFSTDGEISALNLVVLEDDKNSFPPYQVAPVVRQEILEQNPGIEDALNSLTPKITNEIMQRLNYEVTGKQREPAKVAKDFLLQAGLLNNS